MRWQVSGQSVSGVFETCTQASLLARKQMLEDLLARMKPSAESFGVIDCKVGLRVPDRMGKTLDAKTRSAVLLQYL